MKRKEIIKALEDELADAERYQNHATDRSDYFVGCTTGEAMAYRHALQLLKDDR